MHIDTKLSSAAIVDQGNHFKGYDYIKDVGGYAMILTFVVSLTTYLSCCCKKSTPERAAVRNQNASKVAGSGVVYPNVAEFQNYRHAALSITQPETRTRSKGTTEPSQTAALPRPRGLVNNGNTCYFNSVMQALAQTTILENQLGESAELGDVAKALDSFFASVHSKETSALNPRQLQRVIIQRTGKFRFGMQHDSHECLLSILHELRTDERQGRADTLTIVDKIFGGHCMTVYWCKQCGTPCHLCEPFLDISLPICFGEPRKRRIKTARKRPQTPGRPLPVLEVDGHKTPKDHECEELRQSQYTAPDMNKRDIDIGGKKTRNGETKRKKQPDEDSKEGNTENKIQKRDQDSSRYIASVVSEQATVNVPVPILAKEEEYKKAIDLMMKTPSKGSEPRDLSTLDDCLQCYTRKEDITDEYMCRECNSQSNTESDIRLTSAIKQTVFFNPPAVLTIHLKRFENTGKEYVKRNTMIQYNEVLNIGPYCSSWYIDPPSKDIWYTLYAVVVHFGSLKSGHYIAYVKVRDYDEKIKRFLQESYLDRDSITIDSLIEQINDPKLRKNLQCTEPPSGKEGIWYCMNDRTVSAVSVQEVLDQQAFLLFYERI